MQLGNELSANLKKEINELIEDISMHSQKLSSLGLSANKEQPSALHFSLEKQPIVSSKLKAKEEKERSDAEDEMGMREVKLIPRYIFCFQCKKEKRVVPGYILVMKYKKWRFYFGPYEDSIFLNLPIIAEIEDVFESKRFPSADLGFTIARHVSSIQDFLKSKYELLQPDEDGIAIRKQRVRNMETFIEEVNLDKERTEWSEKAERNDFVINEEEDLIRFFAYLDSIMKVRTYSNEMEDKEAFREIKEQQKELQIEQQEFEKDESYSPSKE